ncbi:hypothetical protein ACFV9C_44230 [Kribbella sp. NPDC059898]|uniref:hypothetical protein n=1 Tax=Kribbella sp. NPDC059898 TaxID=3346995 RepID=UPI00365FA444
MELLWTVGVMVAVEVVLLMLRDRSARLEVERLIERAGLPAESRLVEAAVKWQRRRQTILLTGMLAGTLVAGGVVLLVHNGLHFGFASGDVFDKRLLSWLFAAAAVAGAGGLATLAYNYRIVRSAGGGQRAAALRPRRLADYLSPLEIAIQYSCLVLPLVGIGMGVVVLGTAEHPARGWILVVSGLVAVPSWALGLLLQRRALQVNQPAGDKAELLWQEALRASTLRDLGASVLTICWLLGAAFPMSFDWPPDAPHFVQRLAPVLFLVAAAMLFARGVVAASRRGLGRVQRIAG